MLVNEYIMCTKFRSHTSYNMQVTLIHVICCLQTNKYDQSVRVTDIYILTKFNNYNVISFLSYASSI